MASTVNRALNLFNLYVLTSFYLSIVRTESAGMIASDEETFTTLVCIYMFKIEVRKKKNKGKDQRSIP